MKNKKPLIICAIIALCAGILLLCMAGRGQKHSHAIIATNFVGYDFARAITGDKSEVKMLLKPGAEMHDYEPTPQDIIDITNAEFFIYVGGESEKWVADILRDNNIDEGKTIRMMDFVDLKKEDGEEDEYDEHIWTSPVNAIRIIEAIRDRFIAKRPGELDKYTDNAAKYTAKLKTLDTDIREIVDGAKRKTLVFADRFPFRYFVDEYGLDYLAAFPGCAEQTEASSSTIAELVNKIKSESIPIVLKMELTSDSLAWTVSDETGARILMLDSAHNISQEDYDAGITYADIWEDNLDVLWEALN